MDKVILLGTYDFLGFSLCTRLLEEGIQIDGYRWTQEENEEFLEEKKLLIGRNANFNEQIIGANFPSSSEDAIEDAVIVISVYDLFYGTNRNRSISYADIFKEIMEIYNCNLIKKVVCLLPSDYLYNLPSKLGEEINVVRENGVPIQSIYFPTIYGPWQTKTFLFQQYFLKGCSNVKMILDKRECTMDALFINEVIDEIICILNSPERNNIYIKSDVEEKWRKAAQYLTLEDLIPKNELKKGKILEKDLQIVKVMEKISIEKGLELQKEHLKRLLGHSL